MDVAHDREVEQVAHPERVDRRAGAREVRVGRPERDAAKHQVRQEDLRPGVARCGKEHRELREALQSVRPDRQLQSLPLAGPRLVDDRHPFDVAERLQPGAELAEETVVVARQQELRDVPVLVERVVHAVESLLRPHVLRVLQVAAENPGAPLVPGELEALPQDGQAVLEAVEPSVRGPDLEGMYVEVARVDELHLAALFSAQCFVSTPATSAQNPDRRTPAPGSATSVLTQCS